MNTFYSMGYVQTAHSEQLSNGKWKTVSKWSTVGATQIKINDDELIVTVGSYIVVASISIFIIHEAMN